MSLLKMPPTPTEILAAQVAIKAAKIIDETPSAIIVEIANFPLDEASPESEWPTVGR